MKVLLTHAYFLHEDARELLIMKPYPPLGILSISAYLKQAGVDTRVFDATFSNAVDQHACILEILPDVLAVYTNLMTKVNVLKLIQWVRKQPLLASCRIVLGGPDIRYNVENYLGAGADFLVIGEGEQTMLELIKYLDSKAASLPDSVPGLAFYGEEHGLVMTAERSKLKDLDALPLPDRSSIPMEKYLSAWKQHHGKSTLSISTQRGCPYTCKWCSTAVYGQSYRRRSPESVAAEIEGLLHTYKMDALWFVDDVFTVSHKWLYEFRDALSRRSLRVPYECITRADRLNEEVLRLLKQTGCFRVWIGAESGSQAVIDRMDRRVDVLHVREMIRKAEEIGLEAGTFIMLGYPGETKADLNETMKHLKYALPSWFTITVAYPIRGTALYAEIADDMVAPDWSSSTDRAIEFKRTYPRKFYTWAVRWIVNGVEAERYLRSGSFLSMAFIKRKSKETFARWVMQLYYLRA